jgi:hypothetical protein
MAFAALFTSFSIHSILVFYDYVHSILVVAQCFTIDVPFAALLSSISFAFPEKHIHHVCVSSHAQLQHILY